MAVVAEYVAAIKVDDTKVDPGIASVRAKLANVGSGVSTANIDAFASKAGAALSPIGTAATNATKSLNQIGPAATSAATGVSDLAIKQAQLIAQLNNVSKSISGEAKVLADLQVAQQQFGKGQVSINAALSDSEKKLASYLTQQKLLKDELGATTKVINTAAPAVNNLEKNVSRLATAFVPMRPGINQATTALSEMEGVSLLAVTGIGALAVGVLALGKAMYGAAASFDAASDHIRIATGATGERLGALEKSFETVFTSIPTTAALASEAIASLNQRVGLTGPALENLAKTELELARITGGDLKTQLEATTRLFADWDILTGQESESLDLLFKVSQKTGIGVTALAQDMVQFGAPLRLLKFSFEDAAIMLGKFQAEGVELSKVLPGLRMLLSKLSDPTKGIVDAKSAFEEMIKQITNSKTELAGVNLAMEAFGRKAGADLAEAAKQGRFSIEELKTSIAGMHDTIQGTAKDTDDFAEKWRIFKNKMTAALEPTGKIMFDAMTAIIVSITEQGPEVQKAWDKVWANLDNEKTLRSINTLLSSLIFGTTVAAFIVGQRIADKIIDGMQDSLRGAGPALLSALNPLLGAYAQVRDYFRNPMPSGPPSSVPGLPGPDVMATNEAFLNPRRTNPPIDLGRHKKAGQDAAKAFIDGFTEGAAGLSKAVELIAGQSTAQLEHLMDPLSKGAKKNLAETQAALKAETAGINAYLQSIGVAAKFTEAGLAGQNKALRDELGANSTAFANNKEVVDQWEIGLLRATGSTVPQINAYLKSIGQEGDLTAKQLMNANQDTVTSLAKAAKGFEDHSKSAAQDRQEVMLNYAEITKGELPLRDSTALFKLAAQGVLDHAHALESATAFSQPWVEAVNKQKDALIGLAAQIKGFLSGDKDFLNAQAQVAAINQINTSIKSVIDTYTVLGERAGLTGQKLVDSIVPKLKELGSEGEKAAIQLQKSFDQVSFDVLQKKVNSAVNGITEIFTLIPGKFGDMAKEIQKVVNTIDKILGNLHKIFASIPENLGGVFATIINLFKSTAIAVNSSVNSMGTAATSMGSVIASAFAGIASSVGNSSGSVASSVGSAATKGATALGNLGSAGKSSASAVSSSWGGASKSLQVGLGAAAGAFASLTTAMAVTSSTGSKTAGIVSSLFTSTLAGIQAGLAGGPIAGAIVGGISLIGGIIGAFMGKSPLQKAQDEAAMAKAKSDIVVSQQAAIKAVEDVKQSMLKTASDIHDLLESIRFYTAIPKDAFAAFFKDLGKVMANFAEMAKAWLGDSDGKIKVLADDMKAVTEAIAAAPTALTAIGKYLGIPEASIERFFSDLGKLLTRFDVLTADFTKATLKHISKFAELMKPSIELFASTVGAISGMFELKEIPAPNFDILQNALKEIVTRIGQVADYFDKAVLKSIGFFGTTVAPAVELWKNAIDAIKSMVDVPVPTAQDFNNLFGSIQSALIRMSELATSLDTDMLLKAQSIAEASMSIFSAIKAATESLGALRDYKAVGSETFKLLLSDFNQALQMMLDMDALSARFITLAKIFEDNIKIGADHLASAILIFSTAIRNLGFALGAFGVTVIVPGGEVGTTAATGSSSGGFAPSSATGGFAPSAFLPPSGPSAPTRSNVTIGQINVDPRGWGSVAEMLEWFGDVGENVTELIENQFLTPARIAQG